MITDTDKPWFAHHPEGNFHWFAAEQEAIDWANEDMDDWLADNDNEWPDGIDDYIVGKVSQVAVKCNARTKPDESELIEGYDDKGNDWNHVDEICDYKMKPIAEDE